MTVAWWQLKKPCPVMQPQTMVSVVVAVRNESANIAKLLECLKKQDYPSHLWELIVVDDHSQDNTAELVKAFMGQMPLRVLQQVAHEKGKKAALQKGVSEAKGDLILTTDGDCMLQKGWLSTMVASFEREEPHLISGPVCFEKTNSFFGKILTVEFASLVGIGAAAMALKRPFICNGANLGFRKSVFQEVEGYTGNVHIASGDDEFLLRKIKQLPKAKILFVKDYAALVQTRAPHTLGVFFQQRLRWASKWRLGLDIHTMSTAIFVFVIHFCRIVMLGGLFWTQIQTFCATLLCLQMALDILFVGSVLKFFKKQQLWWYLIPTLGFYSFYAVFFGLVANRKHYDWKGRRIQI